MISEPSTLLYLNILNQSKIFGSAAEASAMTSVSLRPTIYFHKVRQRKTCQVLPHAQAYHNLTGYSSARASCAA
jgi:hypothetical protein